MNTAMQDMIDLLKERMDIIDGFTSPTQNDIGRREGYYVALLILQNNGLPIEQKQIEAAHIDGQQIDRTEKITDTMTECASLYYNNTFNPPTLTHDRISI